jgi:hypothetical protein
METKAIIKPNKENPIFRLYNDYIGFIEWTPIIYKDFEIDDPSGTSASTGKTFATSYKRAVNDLMDLLENDENIRNLCVEYPKSKFRLLSLNGEWNKKHDYPKEQVAFEIPASKAKKYFNIK